MLGYCLTVLSGCAVIEDVGAGGQTSHSIVLGAPVNLPATPAEQGRVVKITGLGFATANETTTFGFFNSSEIVLDPRCQVALVGNTNEQLKRFAKLVGNAKNICSDASPVGSKK
jgi:hypothetical protein